METKSIVILVLAVAIAAVFVFAYWFEIRVTDYESCIGSGYPSLESYPAQCNTFLGRHFVQVVEPIGGDRDSHGCLGPAGYSWNASEKECVREWETGEERYQVDDFQSCAALGNGVMESLPRQCQTEGGRRFVEEIVEVGTYFRNEMWRRGVDNLGGAMPIEGFDPSLFMGAFPGLIKEDFEGVSAIGGGWGLNDGELEFIDGNSMEATSADGTIDKEGMAQLMEKLEQRFGMNVENEDDVDDLIDTISVEVGTCPTGFFNESLDCLCEWGYIKSGAPWPTPPEAEEKRYCKINKTWEEFELCDSNDDCPSDYRCFSEETIEKEFRCVPNRGYATSCGCEIGGGCWCT